MERVELETPSGPMDLTLVHPEGEPTAAVLVLQEAFGVTEYLLEVAEQLADEGYLAAVPALFHRQGSRVYAYDDYDSVLGTLAELTAAGLEEDLRASCAELEARGFSAEETGAIGFCMGGTVATFADRLGLVGAAVSFYGGGVAIGRFGLPPLTEVVAEVKAPWLGLYGTLDQGIPPEQVDALDAARKAAPVETQLVRFEADHGFHCHDREAVFDEEAAAEAWALALEFLGEQLA